MRIQLWSYNYDPEPSGIAPLSRAWAEAMVERGHHVDVVAAHPHYPEPRWGTRLRPYREIRNGVPVLRLPIWIGRGSPLERIRQELSFTAAQTAALPALGKPDVLVVVSPCFPALAPAMLNARARRVPWVLWLQDLLPDGAAATGEVKAGPVLRGARWLERAAYRSAAHIIVISETFRENLLRKQVPASRITRIYNWATRGVDDAPRARDSGSPPRLLCMGNIGRSQGLTEVVRAFEADPRLAEYGARLVLAGTGVAAEEVRAAITTDRVEMTGLLFHERLEEELQRATVGVVTQRYEGVEFNVPSKLMNYLAAGLPVLASVRSDSEVARIIERTGAGWVTDAAEPAQFAANAARVLRDPKDLARRGAAGLAFALRNLTPASAAEQSEQILVAVASRKKSAS